jgi:hypothetical protein
MKKTILFTGFVLVATAIMAQDTTRVVKTVKPNLANRANDHFLVQFGYHGWNNIPDTINTKGISKTFNVYFMFDFPFKTNQKLSMAFGPGIASDHMIFQKTQVGIKENAPAIFFTDLSDTNHFKKTKLATVWLEAPVEFRYSADPYTGKGLKLAIGVKVGTLLNAHTRNAKFQTRDETSINDYVMKETSKRFFNKTRLSGMIRAGYGHFTLFGSYSFTPLFKDALGPEVKPFSIGITLSGL